MKTVSKVLILSLVVLLAVAFSFLPIAKKLFLAQISNVSVYVSETQPTPVVNPSVGGGGSYLPIAVASPVPPQQQPAQPIVEQPNNPAINIPIQQPVQPGENVREAPINLLPLAVADLSQKIPQFGDIISNLGIKNSADVANLGNYNIFLPELGTIIGSGAPDLVPAEFTPDQQNKIPSDTVFILLGQGNISASIKMDFSESALSPESVNVLAGKSIRLMVKPSAPAEGVSGYILFKSPGLSNTGQDFSVLKFNYINNGGIYFADIKSPTVEGQYQIVTSVKYVGGKIPQKDIKITTLIDPEGYIYEKVGDKELRINNAIVSLFKLNSQNQYELWSAKEYGQENPQTTDVTGNYSFLVPEGTYYVAVKAPGYYSYQSDPFPVSQDKEVHANIALKKQVAASDFFNWQAIAIIILFVFVFYNFYSDWRRGRTKAKR